MNFFKMAGTRTGFGWAPDLVILAVDTLAITGLGSRGAAATPPAPPASPARPS